VFVSHNLGVVWWFCSRVAVMYLGRVVESGPVARVFGAPRHPYTRILCDASAIPDPGLRGQMQRISAKSLPPPIRRRDATFTPVAPAHPTCVARCIRNGEPMVIGVWSVTIQGTD
jgi:ABC-type dipeptide/oligopeptide/nickel transport system ATPase component